MFTTDASQSSAVQRGSIGSVNGIGGLDRLFISERRNEAVGGRTDVTPRICTLEKWILDHREMQQCLLRQQQYSRDVDLKTRLRVAIAIAKALNEYHKDSNIHGKLSLSSFILHTSDGACVAKLVKVKTCDRRRRVNPADEDPRTLEKKLDLDGLGKIYRLLFGDGELSPGSDLRNGGGGMLGLDNRAKRGKSPTEFHTLEDLPLYLSSLISGLSAGEGECKYRSMEAVVDDLNSAHLHFQPTDWVSLSGQGMLLPAHAFYGRQAELAALMNSLNSGLNSGAPAMAVISGRSGFGKSELVKQAESTIRERNGYMVCGKFDSNGSQSDSVLYRALDSFFDSFVEMSDEKIKAEMNQRIISTVGFGLGELVQSIPGLGRVVGNDFTARDLPRAPREQLIHRWKFLLSKLFDCIASAEHPIVLVLDDFQWCDAYALDLIQTIVADPDISDCCFVIVHRDDDENSQFAASQITDAARSQGMSVSEIKIGPLELSSTNSLISAALSLPPCLSLPLSTTIQSKTAGSPLFIQSLLKLLYEEGMIRLNFNTRRWEYSIESIKKREVPSEIVDYMLLNIAKLSQEQKLVLKLASFLGNNFDYETFCKAEIKQGVKLESLLPSVCQAGYLQEISPQVYKWSHDSVLQAAMKLVPEDKVESFHLLIGSRILLNTPESEMNGLAVLSIADQMNKGRRLIQTSEQRYELARLNLTAGDHSISTSSFRSALAYYLSGIEVLPISCWEDDYETSIRLHEAAQECLFVTGDFTMLSALCHKTLYNGKTLDDKLNSYNNLVRYQVSSGKLEEGIQTCLSVLGDMGEALPNDFTQQQIVSALEEAKVLFSQYTESQILGMPKMTDSAKLAKMEFLQNIFTALNSVRPHWGPAIVAQMVTLSLTYGICDVTAFAFAAYATWVSRDDFQGGYYLATLALKLLQTSGDRFYPRVTYTVFSFVSIYRAPLQSSLDKLLEGYRSALEVGDVEFAYWNIQGHCSLALCTGQKLDKVKQDLEAHIKRAVQCKQTAVAVAMLPVMNAAIELSGVSSGEGDVYETFLGTSEEELLQRLESKNEQRACYTAWNMHKYSSTFRNDMDRAVSFLEKDVSSLLRDRVRSIHYVVSVFADGLIALHMARKNGQDRQKWVGIGESSIETMKKWTYQGSEWNFSNKLFLLEAEYLFVTGHNNIATEERYIASIGAAKRHRFVHEEGLALEKAGRFYLHQGNTEKAMLSFSQASACYECWGAQALVDRLKDEMIELSLNNAIHRGSHQANG